MFSGKDPDQLIYVAEAEISRTEHKVANTEPPWDGFCGLVKICDDEPFKERGVTRIAQQTSHPSSATFAQRTSFPGQNDQGATSLPSHPSPPATSSSIPSAPAAPTQNPSGPHPPHTNTTTTTHAAAAAGQQHPQQGQQPGQGTVSPTASSMSAASEDMPFWVINYVVAASSSGDDSSSPGSPASWVNDLPSPPQDTPLMPS